MQYPSRLVKTLAGIALSATVMAGTAKADLIYWHTNTSYGDCASGYSCNANSRTFLGSDGTTTVTAKAWGLTDRYNDELETASLGFYANGLGVTSQEGEGHYNSHTVDNYSRYDMVAFFFSEVVDLAGLFLSAYGDTDTSVWIGTEAVMPDLTGASLTDLDNMYGDHFDDDGNSSDRLAWFGSDHEEGNFMIVAGEINTEKYADKFKIALLKAYSVEPPPVRDEIPEPGSMAVFGLGLLGLLALRRRGSADAVGARA